MPSNFDSNYCYGLGQVAGSLISMNFTGYMSTLRNLKEHVNQYFRQYLNISQILLIKIMQRLKIINPRNNTYMI